MLLHRKLFLPFLLLILFSCGIVLAYQSKSVKQSPFLINHNSAPLSAILVISSTKETSPIKTEQTPIPQVDAYFECPTQSESDYSGYLTELSYPQVVQPGQIFPISWKFKNTGKTPWTGEDCSLPTRLSTTKEDGHPSVFGNSNLQGWLDQNYNRIVMQEKVVSFGETATFTVEFQAPAKSGLIKEYFVLLAENQKKLIETEQALTIYVNSAPEIITLNPIILQTSVYLTLEQMNAPELRHLQIDLSEQKMRIFLGDQVINTVGVSSGKADTPTPRGKFKILFKQDLRISSLDLPYHMPFFMGFGKNNFNGYGIHALPYLPLSHDKKNNFWTEAREHIGLPVSHGCVRILPENAALLYEFIPESAELEIKA